MNAAHSQQAVRAFPASAIHVATPGLPGITLNNGFRFRKGQQQFLEKLAAAFAREQDNHLGVFVPGYGKTITALSSFVIAHALGVARKLVVFVPRGNLRDQYADPKELNTVFSNLGASTFSFCVADSERVFLKNLDTQIIITTYQYASGKGGHKALQKFCETAPCMFVFDEVHHLSDDGLWATKLSKFPFACSIALSGTPMRSDSKTLFGVPFEIRGNNEQYYIALHEVSLRDAHEEGKILKRVAVHVIDYKIKMTRTDTGEMVELSLSAMAEMAKSKNEIDAFLARKKLRFHDVYLQSILRPAFDRFAEKRQELARERLQGSVSGTRNHQMLIIAMSNRHAAAILEYIREHFPQCSSARIGQDIPEQERLRLLEEYRNGSLDVMVQVDMIGEGTDIKPISVIVKADLVRAFSKTMQQIFRGMRYFNSFSDEANVCDIYAANDSDVVDILEWISSEEQLGIKLKQQRLLDEEIIRNNGGVQESLWELTAVEHRGTETHSLELFPGYTRPQELSTTQPKPDAPLRNAIDISAREQELRTECAGLASKFSFMLKSTGRIIEVSQIHAEAKRRFAKAQEQMSVPELTKKRDWLLNCLAARKMV